MKILRSIEPSLSKSQQLVAALLYGRALQSFQGVVLTSLAGALFVFSATRSSVVELPNALVPAIVEVPSSLRTAPSDQDRVLMVPPGFKISVSLASRARDSLCHCRLARFSWRNRPRKHFIVRPQVDGTVSVSALIEDLKNPQGMALHQSDHSLYLFVGESNQVSRFLIAPGAASAGGQTVIVPNLPDSSSRELRGPYRHGLKNLVIGPNDKLYVDIASSTNADP